MSLLKSCIVAVLLGVAGSSAGAQTFESLYSFAESGGDGLRPSATLTIGPPGPDGKQRLYGTAVEGGGGEGGTIFSVSTDGQVIIHGDFDPETTGQLPYARLLNIGDGYLYGVTEKSSKLVSDWAGTVYKYHPQEGLSQVTQIPSEVLELPGRTPTYPRALAYGEANALHVLCADYPGLWRVSLNPVAREVAYAFDEYEVDGHGAWTLIRGTDSYFYGTTVGSSDAGDYPNGRGTIFRIAPNGTGMTRLHECQWETGTRPYGALVEAPDGSFYGVMGAGGKHGAGCIYRLTPSGQYTVLYHFGSRKNDLRYPLGDLMLGTDGQLYGTASEAGTKGYGGVFRIKTNGTGYKILHSFNGLNGAHPHGGVVLAADGHLYGTTREGGEGNNGTVFRIKMNLPSLPENRLPVAVSDLGVILAGDEVDIDVRANDYDPDGDALMLSIKTAPTAGTVEIRAGGVIRYTADSGAVLSDQFTYTIIDGRGGEASATVRITRTAPEPLLTPGLYQGLLMFDPELSGDGDVPRGLFNVKVGVGGRFTGVLFAERKRLPLRGTFSASGKAVMHLKLPKKRSATLFLSLEAGEPNIMRSVLFGQELWSGAALPAQQSDSSQKESFTALLLPDADALPDGNGFAVMKLSPTGAVTMVGKLGDGSKLSWSSTLVLVPGGAKIVPVFSEPMAGGFCGGWLERKTGAETPSFLGSLLWKRPAAAKPTKPYPLGFTGKTNLVAFPFIPPASAAPVLDLTDGTVEIDGGKLTESVTGEFTVNGKKVATSGNLRALTFNRNSGLFSGKMLVGKKAVSFQGVVVQPRGEGGGQFVISGETGSVELGAVKD